MSKISTKKLISWLHLWPGLISAVIVFFVCITGTIIVYSDEIMDLSAGDAKYVEEVKETRLPVDSLISIIKKEFPSRSKAISYMVTYKDPNRSIRFNTFSRTEGLSMIYIDPYSGKILKDDNTIYFFYVTAHLHNSFLLGKTGQWIIDIATIIFLIELITGIVLWLPKKWNQKTRNASLKIKFKSTAKRLNYDLHKVLGFYALIIMLILSLTGLLIAFEPLSDSLLKLSGAETSHEWQKKMPKFQEGKQPADINTIIKYTFDKYPDKEQIQLNTFKLDSSGYYVGRVADRIGLKSAQSPEFFYYDRYTGKELTVSDSILKHEKIENAVWVLHMGNWMGQVGKFITFMGGLIASSLPITGFFIWWSKRKKKK